MFEINLFLLHFALVQPRLLHGFNLPSQPIHVLNLIQLRFPFSLPFFTRKMSDYVLR